MPFSDGIFQRRFNWVDDKNASVKITASRMDAEFDSVAQGLNDIVSGTQAFTGNVKVPFGTAAAPGLSFNTDSNTGVYRPAADTLAISAGGVDVASFTPGGMELPTGSVSLANGTAAAPSLCFNGEGDTGLYQAAAQTLGLAVGGADVASLDSTGLRLAAGKTAVLGQMSDRAAGKAPARPMAGLSRTIAVLPNINSLGVSSLQNIGTGLGIPIGQVVPPNNGVNPRPVTGDPSSKFRRVNIKTSYPLNYPFAEIGEGTAYTRVFLGDAASGGGFDMNFKVGISHGANTPSLRARFGVSLNSMFGGDIEPSSVLHSLFFGWDSADINCQILYRGSGAATKIDLGPSFPVPTTNDSSFWDVRFFSPNNETGKVYYDVINHANGAVAAGSFTHPSAPGQWFCPTFGVSSGGPLVEVGFTFGGCVIEFND